MAAVTALAAVESRLRDRPLRWLVTGSAGFIGSHLAESLLALGQDVVSLDNFSTGHASNLDDVRATVGADAWRRHTFIEGDIVNLAACRRAVDNVDVVLHQAALGSVPRSLADPLATHAANATGFLNMLVAARDAGVKRFVYAASSSTYGDHPGLPKVEHTIGRPLSPYAVTKYVNELYADVFGRCYGLQAIGLRYFNVFGPRQDPEGPYAAVIPSFAGAIVRGDPCTIHGDGETSRDFCYIANAVQANLLAALTEDAAAIGEVFNVAAGGRTTLSELHRLLAAALRERAPATSVPPPIFGPFRAGDVRHSQADIGKARRLLGYQPSHDVAAGIAETAEWYLQRQRGVPAARRASA
jgi:UDP-N-acetylglucosamine/UDP-N-acetylgalactosamine 4-epimerase